MDVGGEEPSTDTHITGPFGRKEGVRSDVMVILNNARSQLNDARLQLLFIWSGVLRRLVRNRRNKIRTF